MTKREVCDESTSINEADSDYKLAWAIVGDAKNGKYIAKTNKRYKSKPMRELSDVVYFNKSEYNLLYYSVE